MPPLAVMSDVSTQVGIIWGCSAATDWWHDGLHVSAVWLGLTADSSAGRRRIETLICATDQMQERKRLQENKKLLCARVHTHTHSRLLAYCWLTCSVMQCDCRWPAAVVTKAHSHYWEHWSSINPVRVWVLALWQRHRQRKKTEEKTKTLVCFRLSRFRAWEKKWKCAESLSEKKSCFIFWHIV